jgi:putative membrane protein
MTVDAVLASIHHIAAFALVGIIVAELVLLRGRLDGEVIRRFGRIDALYGLSAAVVVIAGIARLLFGQTPVDYYLGNLFFWIKMAAFAAVAILSIYPTALGVRWRRAIDRDPTYSPPVGEVAAIRRSLTTEVVVLPIIPIAAALMARGFGVL